MKKLLLTLLLGAAATSYAQNLPTPPVYFGGPIGPAGSYPTLNGGSFAMPSDANYTLTYPNTSGISLTVTSAVSLTATRNIVVPSGYFIFNACNYTSGSQSIQFIGATGTGAVIANGTCSWVKWDGTNWVTTGGGSGSSGFPITLGSTSISASSTTTSLAGLTVDGVNPTTFGFLDPTSSVQTQLNAKAPLASPALTGTPTAPTPLLSDNSTELATTAYTRAYIASLSYLTGTGTTGHCAQWASSTTLGDAGAACGTSSGMNQLTGDVLAGPGTGSQAATLATVNSNTGSFGDATHTVSVTYDAKGRATAVSQNAISAASINGVSCSPGASCTIPVAVCAGPSPTCAVQQINPALNGLSTTLSASITTTQTTIPLTSAAGMTSPLIVAIDINNNAIEWVGCTGISSNTLTGCTRGYYTATPGTGSAHSSGETVQQVVLAYSTSSTTTPFYYILQNGAIGYNGCSNQTPGQVCYQNPVAFANQINVGGAGATNGEVNSVTGAGTNAPDWTPNYIAHNENGIGSACGWADDEFLGATSSWDLFSSNAFCTLGANGVGPNMMGFAYAHTFPGAMYWDTQGNVTAKTFTATGYNRPNTTQVTGKSGFLPAGGSYQIFSATGAGTITFEHVTLGVTGSDARNLVQNSALDIQCDGNFVAVPFGMFFNAMDAPKPYNTDYQSVPVMGSAFTGNVDGAMVFNRRTWINFYTGCTITLVNASATATANVFVDTTYRVGTPVPAKNAATPRWYWNAYANYLPAVGPNSGSFNTPQVYLMPTSTFSGGGEVESISYYVDAANQSYLESGPVTWADGSIATQSGGGEDWATCGYYCNLGAQSIILSRAAFIGGSFLQDPAGAGDTMMWRRFDTNTDDNVPFTSTLAVSSANGDAGVATTPSIAMNGLTTFWTTNPTTSEAQFSPAAGTYGSTQSVTLSAYPSGATVCYTTNGTTPVATPGACTTGTLYTAPVSVPVTTTINAATAKTGFNNGILTSALYTITNSPVYVGTCAVPGVVTTTTTVSCATAVTAGDFAFAMCRGSNASATYSMSAPGDTFTQLTVAGTGPTAQASYAFSLAGGTTTFTCTASVATGFQGLQVLIYHPGPLTALGQYATNVLGSNTTWTSATLTTTNPGLVIACANPGFGTSGVTFTAGTINGVASNNRSVNASASSMCEDQTFASTFTSGTATVTSSTAGPWDGIIAAFH